MLRKVLIKESLSICNINIKNCLIEKGISKKFLLDLTLIFFEISDPALITK